MSVRLSLRTTAAALSFAVAVTFGVIGAGAAVATPEAPGAGPHIVAPGGDPLTASTTPEEDAAIAELTPIVEQAFTQVLTPNSKGAYVFDREKTESTLGKATADRIAAEADSAVAAKSFPTCVLEKAGYGALAGLFAGAYKELIEKKLWKEVAKVIIKTVGASAVKGGVVGLAASLSAAAIYCGIFG